MRNDLAGPVLLGCQVFQVLFLFAHDWVPLGRLTDLEAQRRADPLAKRVLVTVLSGLPYLLLLASSFTGLQVRPVSQALLFWLWLGYGLLFAGELRAWWVPYLLRPDHARAERYRALFGRTHAFLHERHGMRPNTLHVVLHATTFATLVCLARLSWTG